MVYRFAYRRYALPFLHPVRTAHGSWQTREGLIIWLEDEKGRVGFGEAAPISWFGMEEVDELEAACRAFGDDVTRAQLEAIPKALGSLRFAVYSAEYDIASLRSEDSAETKHELPKYLPVAALLPAGKSVLGRLDPLIEAGFRTFKWKVGVGDASDELAILDDVLARLPSGSRLRLDANGAWDRRRAQRWLERVAERPIEFVEQPIAFDERGAEDSLLGLAGDYPTPIALDESVTTASDYEKWAGLGWPGLFVIKPVFLAEPDSVIAKIDPKRRVFSSALETAVGARQALRLAFLHAGAEPRALGFGVWPLFQNASLNGPSLAPFIRLEDVERLDAAAAWNALV